MISLVVVVVFLTFSELRKHNITIPTEMEQNLMLLHSYVLVKVDTCKEFDQFVIVLITAAC